MPDEERGPESAESLERAKLQLERQRLTLDVLLKRRELNNRSRSVWREALSNPLSLAIVGGFISIIATIATSTVNAYYDREKIAQTAVLDGKRLAQTATDNRNAEISKAKFARESASEALQADLIKKFVEGPSIDRVRQNLTFLADAGLVPSYQERIRHYLATHPNSAPQVPASGSITGMTASEGVRVQDLPEADPLRRDVAPSVGRVLVSRGDRESSACTGFLIAPDRVLTVGYCLNSGDTASFEINGAKVEATLSAREFTDQMHITYAVLQLSQSVPAVVPLKLGSRAPVLGEALSIVYFETDEQRAVRSSECKVTAVSEQSFEYGCRTGRGSAGSPVLSADGSTVLGIHVRKANAAGTLRQATRADAVVRALAQAN